MHFGRVKWQARGENKTEYVAILFQSLADDLNKKQIFGWAGATNIDDPGLVKWVSTGNEVDVIGNITKQWEQGHPR